MKKKRGIPSMPIIGQKKPIKQAVIKHKITKLDRAKIERYCEITFQKTMIHKLADLQTEFVQKCLAQIKAAEDITGKNYLDFTKV